MPRFVHILLLAAVGFFVAAVLSYALISWLSSNQHDRSVEAAMSAIFVFGPLGAIIAGVVAFLRTSP